MKISKDGLELVKGYEGLRLKAYLCQAGVPTIGYGHTSGVKLGQTITLAQAEDFLRADLAEFERGVEKALNGVPASPAEFSAMVSLAFNIGVTAFAKSSVLRHHRAGNRDKAAAAFGLWNKVRKDGKLVPSKGLTRRRAAEAELYLGTALHLADEKTGPVETAEVPEQPKALATSRTIIGASIAAAGVTAGEVATQLQPLIQLSEMVKPLFICVTILGLALTAYARFDDRRQGRN